MRKIIFGVIGFFVGGLLLVGFGSIAGVIGAIIGMVIGAGAGSRDKKAISLCGKCLDIQLEGMTVRGLISSDIFRDMDAKAVLILHLFNYGGCDDCKRKAIAHARAFAHANGIDFNVDRFVNSILEDL